MAPGPGGSRAWCGRRQDFPSISLPLIKNTFKQAFCFLTKRGWPDHLQGTAERSDTMLALLTALLEVSIRIPDWTFSRFFAVLGSGARFPLLDDFQPIPFLLRCPKHPEVRAAASRVSLALLPGPVRRGHRASLSRTRVPGADGEVHPSPIWPPGGAWVCVIAVSSQVLVQSGQIVTEPSHVTHGRGLRALVLRRPGGGARDLLGMLPFSFPEQGLRTKLSCSSRQL